MTEHASDTFPAGAGMGSGLSPGGLRHRWGRVHRCFGAFSAARVRSDRPGWRQKEKEQYERQPATATISQPSVSTPGRVRWLTQAFFESIQPPGADPMIDFDERDLVRHAEHAGFPAVDLELRVSVKAAKRPVPWEQFLRMSGNPLTPPVAETLDRVLSPQEITEFTEYLRPLVESGTGRERMALAYLTAVKSSQNARAWLTAMLRGATTDAGQPTTAFG